MTAVETIVFPDSVAVCSLYLAAALVAGGDTTTHVGGRVKHDGNFVVLELIDAQNDSLVIQKSTIRVDCWVDDGPLSKQNAQDLGQLCRGLLGAMQETIQAGAQIYRVADGSPGLNDIPDPVTGKRVFSFHFIIGMRGGATLDPSTVVSIPDWLRPGALPSGGTPGQVLTNTSPGEGDWEDPTGGSGDIADAVALAPATSIRNVVEGVGDVTELTLQASAGQTEAVYVVKDENGNELFSVSSTGRTRITVPGGGTVNPFEANVDMVNGPFGLTVDPTGGVFIWGGLDRPAVLQVQSDNRSVNPFQPVFLVGNHLANDIFSCVDNGEVVVRGAGVMGLTLGGPPAEPPDANLASSEVTFWLDSTAGAPSLRLKAKDADGDVFTATIPMTPA